MGIRTAFGEITIQVIHDGATPANGTRGPGRWDIAVSSLPVNTVGAQAAWNVAANFVSISPGPQVPGDQAWFFTGPTTNPTRQGVWIFTGSFWVEQHTFIDGNLLIGGTVTAANVIAGSLTDSFVPAGLAKGSYFSEDGTGIIGSRENYVRFDGTDLIVQGKIVNLVPSHLEARGGGPFTSVTDRFGATFTDADLIDGAGAYVFVMCGTGGGGSGATSDGNFPYNRPAGGGGAGIAIFSFVWDGTTAMSCFLSGGGGRSGHGDRISGGVIRQGTLAKAGVDAVFMYNGTAMVTARGGGVPTDNASAGTRSDAPGGTVSYTIPSGLMMLSQISRTGQTATSATGSNASAGACDFFGDIDITRTSNISSGSSAFGDYDLGQPPGTLLDIVDTRSILGFGSGSVRGLGFIGGVSYNQATFTTDGSSLHGGNGGVFASGGFAAVSGFTTGGVLSRNYAFGGDGGLGGGGGGAFTNLATVDEFNSNGGEAGAAALFWSKL